VSQHESSYPDSTYYNSEAANPARTYNLSFYNFESRTPAISLSFRGYDNRGGRDNKERQQGEADRGELHDTIVGRVGKSD
jgi:hypothetical protein